MLKYFLFALVILSACNSDSHQTIQISAVNRDTTVFRLSDSKMPSTLTLRIKGITDDSCIVKNIYLKGKIDTLLSIDYYNDTVAVHYQAYKAKKGMLKIDCKTY